MESKVASPKPTMMYSCYPYFALFLYLGLLATFHLFIYLKFKIYYLFYFSVLDGHLKPKFSGPIMWLFSQNP
jgi:hypothetical protein